jgi:hypothetical protein
MNSKARKHEIAKGQSPTNSLHHQTAKHGAAARWRQPVVSPPYQATFSIMVFVQRVPLASHEPSQGFRRCQLINHDGILVDGAHRRDDETDAGRARNLSSMQRRLPVAKSGA